jgi:steroid delta-isomerase-like uncharacterized protein
MSAESNKELVRRFLDTIWNRRDLTNLAEFLAPNVISYPPHDRREGIEDFKENFREIYQAVPDLQFTLEDLVAEGDRVADRWQIRGTHRGEIAGIAPTGKQVSWTGMAFFRIEKGKIVEHWNEVDRLSLMQQLGALPQEG